MKENLHKILSIGKTLNALGFSSRFEKQKHNTQDDTIHPNDPYSAKALRFTTEEKLIIQPMVCLKNGFAKQFVGLLIKGIVKNKETDTPARVCDLIDDTEKLLLPQAHAYVQKYPGNIMFQENLEDLKTIVRLYRQAYKRTAEEDKSQIVITKSNSPLHTTRERHA